MLKSAVITFIILMVAGGLWFNKVINFIETEEHNGRVSVNNEIVAVINDLQNKLEEPKILLEQFIDLSALSESQQRGVWDLLDLFEVDFNEDIDEAISRLSAIDVSEFPEFAVLKEKSLNLVESYRAYTPAYNHILKQIKTRTLAGPEIELIINTQMNNVATLTTPAAEAFMLAQEAMLRSD